MDYLIIFVVIFILLLIALFTRLVKGALKVFFLVSMVLTLIFAVSTYFIYEDVTEFKEGWENHEKLFLFQDQGYLMGGFTADPKNIESTVTPIDKETLKSYKEPFTKQEYDKILGDNYKIFFIDYKTFEDLEDIEILNTKLDVEQVKVLIMSTTPTKDFAKFVTGQDLPMDIDSEKDEMFKSGLFAALFAKSMEQKGPLFIIEEVKNKNIRVYPETALFTSLRMIPLSLIKQVFEQVIDAGKEGVTAAVVATGDFLNTNKGEIYEFIR